MLEAFESTWSKVRSTFGQGIPQQGEAFDNSGQLRELQRQVASAAPGHRWTGSAAEAYASTNDRHGAVLGRMAEVDLRLRVEVDRSAAVVAAGRRELDAVRDWVRAAASSVPNNAAGERMLVSIVGKGANDMSTIVRRANGDLADIAERVRDIGTEYQALTRPEQTGPGDVQNVVGEEEKEPWRFPFDPPPPPDSAPGGGRWEYGQGYPPGPGGGPPMGPIPVSHRWHRDVEPPVVGGTSTLKEVVPPKPNGWGVDPAWTLREAYRFRVTGEGFNGDPSHVRWAERDGKWYQATWLDYELEAEHVRAMVPHNDAAGYPMIRWGENDWKPIDIKDIYGIQVDNPRLPLYIPNPFGGQHHLPVPSPDNPIVVSGG